MYILGPDGYGDLTLKFNAKEFAALFAGAAVGDVLVVPITGELNDGSPFIGEDVIVLVK